MNQLTHSKENFAPPQEDLTKTILIVDDDLTNRLVLCAIIKRLGYAVVQANNGQEALTSFLIHKPNLILMDVMMPIMDGVEATRRIKAQEENYTPIIYLTAIADEHELSRAIEAGGDDFLTKPYSHVLLAAKIQSALRTGKIYSQVNNQYQALNYQYQIIQEDMALARGIFSRISRPNPQEFPNLRYKLQALEILNGDIVLAAHGPNNCQRYLLGDATGHGLGAAICAMVVADSFQIMCHRCDRPEEVILGINHKLKKLLPAGRFFSACLIELDFENQSLKVWNGGMPDVIVCSSSGDILHRISSAHPPLGILDNEILDTSFSALKLVANERVYAFSDGLIEALNTNNEMLGQKRVETTLINASDGSDRLDSVLRTLAWFTHDAPQNDDISILEVTHTPNHKQPLDRLDAYCTL